MHITSRQEHPRDSFWNILYSLGYSDSGSQNIQLFWVRFCKIKLIGYYDLTLLDKLALFSFFYARKSTWILFTCITRKINKQNYLNWIINWIILCLISFQSFIWKKIVNISKETRQMAFSSLKTMQLIEDWLKECDYDLKTIAPEDILKPKGFECL